MTIVVPDGVARIVARGSAGPAVALTVHNNVAIGPHFPGKLRWPADHGLVRAGQEGRRAGRSEPLNDGSMSHNLARTRDG